MRESVHDNWIYAQAVDHERCRVVLHTVWPHCEPPEYTDVVFDGVVVHHFEQQKVGGGPYPANVLFDAEESEPAFILGQYTELLARTTSLPVTEVKDRTKVEADHVYVIPPNVTMSISRGVLRLQPRRATSRGDHAIPFVIQLAAQAGIGIEDQQKVDVGRRVCVPARGGTKHNETD